MMACPTCDHTMQLIGEPDGAGQRYWCPRCGTLRTIGKYGGDDVPKLVERCQEFERNLAPAVHPGNDAHGHMERWESIGIAEAINLPDARPTTRT